MFKAFLSFSNPRRWQKFTPAPFSHYLKSNQNSLPRLRAVSIRNFSSSNSDDKYGRYYKILLTVGLVLIVIDGMNRDYFHKKKIRELKASNEKLNEKLQEARHELARFKGEEPPGDLTSEFPADHVDPDKSK
jgi:hypothetical protein